MINLTSTLRKYWEAIDPISTERPSLLTDKRYLQLVAEKIGKIGNIKVRDLSVMFEAKKGDVLYKYRIECRLRKIPGTEQKTGYNQNLSFLRWGESENTEWKRLELLLGSPTKVFLLHRTLPKSDIYLQATAYKLSILESIQKGKPFENFDQIFLYLKKGLFRIGTKVFPPCICGNKWGILKASVQKFLGGRVMIGEGAIWDSRNKCVRERAFNDLKADLCSEVFEGKSSHEFVRFVICHKGVSYEVVINGYLFEQNYFNEHSLPVLFRFLSEKELTSL